MKKLFLLPFMLMFSFVTLGFTQEGGGEPADETQEDQQLKDESAAESTAATALDVAEEKAEENSETENVSGDPASASTDNDGTAD